MNIEPPRIFMSLGLLCIVDRSTRKRGENVLLSTFHVLMAHMISASLTYTLELPNLLNIFPTFHSLKLKHFITNDPELFPHHKLPCPGPVLTADGLEEYFVDKILDLQQWGCRWQFLIHWSGYSLEHDSWLSVSTLQDCEVLDRWLVNGEDGLAMW